MTIISSSICAYSSSNRRCRRQGLSFLPKVYTTCQYRRPDLSRRIYPVVATVTEDGYQRMPEDEIGQAVHGLGGVGKTELAVRVAREQAHSAYPRVPSPPSKPRDDEVDGTHEQNREHQPQNDSLQDPEEPRELLFCGAGRVKSGSLATDRAVKVTSEHSVPVAAEVEE